MDPDTKAPVIRVMNNPVRGIKRSHKSRHPAANVDRREPARKVISPKNAATPKVCATPKHTGRIVILRLRADVKPGFESQPKGSDFVEIVVLKIFINYL